MSRTRLRLFTPKLTCEAFPELARLALGEEPHHLRGLESLADGSLDRLASGREGGGGGRQGRL